MAFQKGHTYGKRFVKGQVPWNKGISHTPEHKEKLKLAWIKRKEKGLGHTTKGKHITHSGSFKMGHKPLHYGENHWKWKGGITTENRKLRNSTNWKQWREAVFKRDNYTCLHCDSRCCMLHPHHVVPISECLALNYQDLIFDIDNGDTLCVDCHLNKGLHRGIG